VAVSGAVKLTLAYPDGPHDAESLLVDPLTRDLYIITKRESPEKRVYRASYPQSTSGTNTLQFVTSFAADVWLTSADISPDGDQILVRGTEATSGRIYLRPDGGTLADAFHATPTTIPLLSELQGEAIGFDPQGWGYYTTSEGAGAPIHYFDRLPPHATWTSTTSGSFAAASNWDTNSAPQGNFAAHFGAVASGSGPAYSVSFGADASSSVVLVHRDSVTWNLNGATYAQSGAPGVDSLIVGTAFGENADLTINNGKVTTGGNSFSQIGKSIGATGRITLGPGAIWNNTPPLLVGKHGSGALLIGAGAAAVMTDVVLGGSVGSAGGSGVLSVSGGSLLVSGMLKAWGGGTALLSGGSISVGSMQLHGGGKALLSAGGAVSLRAGSLSIESSAGSKLDLTDHAMIVDYAGASPVDEIKALLVTGRAGGAWTGNGITSSSAALLAAKMAVGYAEASDLSLQTFAEQPVDGTCVVLAYALAGDADLSGTVDSVDFNLLASNFGSENPRWSQGDFNYDALADTIDFNYLANNFGSTLAAVSMTAVPEGGALPLLASIAIFSQLNRKRRRN
jgi:T5SS/PEP-CTERM-associated repeat protein